MGNTLEVGDTVYVEEPRNPRCGHTGTVTEVLKWGYAAWVRFPDRRYSEQIRTSDLRKEPTE